ETTTIFVATAAPLYGPLPWPITTVSPGTNPVPVIVMLVPPVIGPEAGDTAETDATVEPLQSTAAVRSQWLPSSVSSAQNACSVPPLHSLAGCTVKPSLLRFCVAPVGREYTVTGAKWPWFGPAVCKVMIDVRPWQELSQSAQSSCWVGSHRTSMIV